MASTTVWATWRLLPNVTEYKVDDDVKKLTDYRLLRSTNNVVKMYIDWFEPQEEANATQVLLLRKIKNIAARKAHTPKKQTEKKIIFYACAYAISI